MRIAQVAPLWELVPPRTYGGSELVVYLLTEELVRRGHEVTLFAAGGTQTSANLVTCCPTSLREMEEQIEKDKTHCTVMSYELMMLQTVFHRASEFDVIHNHVGFQALPYAEFVSTPMVTTLHNALDPLPVRELFQMNAHLPYISISDYQRKLWPELNYEATIYHGINLSTFEPSFEHEGKEYLAFLGRLSPEKGPHHAIQAALAMDMPLIMAGKIDRVDRIYYDREIAPLVDGERIKYIGEVNHAQKVELLRHAAATLCPVEWPEPFGLVMIESMACGTPVFALRDGSVPEVIDHGLTGYVANSVPELIEALRQYKKYDRRQVRAMAEQRFSVQRMVDDHLKLYADLAEQAQRPLVSKVSSLAGEAKPGIFDDLLTPSQVAAMKHNASAKRNGNMHKSRFNHNREANLPNLPSMELNLAATQDNAELSEYYPDAFTGP